jgi:antitoxin HicB
MATRSYTVIVYPDGDAYSVIVPALPGCVTYGRTPEEAMHYAHDAIGLWLEELEACGEPVPDDIDNTTRRVHIDTVTV